MGIYDRDYARPETTLLGGPLSSKSATVILLALNIGAFLLNAVFNMFVRGEPDAMGRTANSDVLFNWMAVNHNTIARPWMWWQFLTYGFAHSTANIWHIVFNMFVLYVFGNTVERRIGRNEFFRFYLTAVILGGFLWGLKSFALGTVGSLVGASGGVQAVTILFAFLFPDAIILVFMVFPMKAWIAGSLAAAFNLYGAMFGPGAGTTAYDVHLVGIAFAAIYHLRRWNLGRMLPRSLGDFQSKLPKKRPALKIHDPNRRTARDDAEADRILEKIHRDGEASLTRGERRFMESYSKRKREQRNS